MCNRHAKVERMCSSSLSGSDSSHIENPKKVTKWRRDEVRHDETSSSDEMSSRNVTERTSEDGVSVKQSLLIPGQS